MREGVMSAGVLFAQSTVREKVRSEEESIPEVGGWNPEDFAREQIRGLVRQVFFSNVERPVRQVVFSAMDQENGCEEYLPASWGGSGAGDRR
jgi:hypothetical protein